MAKDISWAGRIIAEFTQQAALGRQMMDKADASGWDNSRRLTEADNALFERWVRRTQVAVRDLLGQTELANFGEAVSEGYGQHHRNTYVRCERGVTFLENLIRIAREFPGQLTYSEPALSLMKQRSSGNAPIQPRGDIFIIHGRDELNVLLLEKLLKERFGLQVCVLSDQPAKGRTIIEKFEQEAEKCGYAFCLLTPDDHVTKDGVTYAQGRPNATFELGYFCGRLGRSRICILMKKGTHIHSDFDGVNRLEFTDRVTEAAAALETELLAAKIPLKKKQSSDAVSTSAN